MVKEESEKAGLKLSIHDTMIMASSPITSCKQMGESGSNNRFSWPPSSLRTLTAVVTLGHSLLGRKAMTNPDSAVKSRDIALLAMVRIVKARVFPEVNCGCETWTTKKG